MIALDPRPVFCVIDDACRSLVRADQVRAGVFDLAGTEVSLGAEPRWIDGDFPADEEWRIEFSKFYYGLDLGHAAAVSGCRTYLDRWRELVLSWIDTVPHDHDPTDVAARRIQNWTYAWNRFAAADEGGLSLGDADAERVLASIAEQVDYIRSNLAVERNHRTLELYALFITALAHRRLDESGELLRFAAFELHRNLRADLLVDGVHRERSTHYHAIALRSFLGARVNASMFGLELPPGYDEGLHRGLEFLAAVIRPDGSLPMLSDGDDGDYRGLLGVAASVLGREDLAWVASQGACGEPPTETTTRFDSGGYYVQRSGWGDGVTPFEAERHLVFDCGPVGDSGHGHYDALHVEISSDGHPLLVDPGRYTYAEDGEPYDCADLGGPGPGRGPGSGRGRVGDNNWRHWFKGTAAHNTVCVDGTDQVGYRRGKQKGPTSQARFLELVEAEGVTSFLGEVISPCYDAVHQRRVLFIDGRWWIIEDTLRAHDDHHYDLRFHLAPRAQGRVALGPSGAVTAPGLTMIVLADDSQTSDLEPVVARIEPGWVAPTYGVRRAAPVVAVERSATNTRFVTVAVPTLVEGATPPPVSVTSAEGCRLEMAIGGRREQVSWGSEGLRWHRW